MPHDEKIPADTEGHWVGKAKERYDLVLKYLSGNTTSRGYCVHSFVDKNGARFLAFQDTIDIVIEEKNINSFGAPIDPDSGEIIKHELVTGDCFTCKATVNRHGINNYKYGGKEPFKETVLNRIKFKKYLGKAS